MQQQTKEWHDLRKTKIGASDAPVIMGVSPWRTPVQLWEEKLGLRIPEERSAFMKDYMEKSITDEGRARETFRQITGIEMFPTIVVSNEYPFMMASLDGLSRNGRYALEIKRPGKEDHAKAMDGVIPEKYFPQLQHQMVGCKLDMIFYFSYNEKTSKVIEVKKNDDYVSLLLEKELEFWDCWQNLKQPPLCERDYEEKQDAEWCEKSTTIIAAQKQRRYWEAEEERLKKHLISLSEGRNCRGAGITLSRHVRSGTVDYKAIPELSAVNIENYRKEPVEYWKIGII